MLLSETVAAALDRLHPGGALGLAVSGGGDSMALMHLAARWAAARGVTLAVASVDHGLRRDSGAEAASVARDAATLGLPADVLAWPAVDRDGRDRRGNLQAAARAARTRLLADWATAHGLAAVALGHTQDDQAETVLMRLARGAGADGLAAMAARGRRGGVLWLRPLLGVPRAALRTWLSEAGIGWVEDPSNADPRFLRVRTRAALAALAPLGLGAEALAALAGRMQATVAALDAGAAALATEAASLGPCGDIALDRTALRAASPEIALRLLAACLVSVSGAPVPPRRAPLLRLHAALATGDGATLHGCVLAPRGRVARIVREAAAIGGCAGGVWDRRWRVDVCASGAVGPLGEAGLAALRRAAAAGHWQPARAWAESPRGARAATPALWQGGRLACAPVAAYGVGLSAAWAAGQPPGTRLR